MAHRVLKQTETMAIVKVWGLTGTTNDTITLATDLLSSTMQISGTPTVNITGISWSVTPGASDLITITRNAVPVGYYYKNGQMDFAGNWGISEDTNNTNDIAVTIVGSGVCYILVRKVAGYKSMVNPETYGSYDNTASTTS